MRCRTSSCPVVDCEYPITKSDCCPSCDGCFYNGMTYRDEENLPSNGQCRQCQCSVNQIVVSHNIPVLLRVGAHSTRFIAVVAVTTAECSQPWFESETRDSKHLIVIHAELNSSLLVKFARLTFSV